MPAQSEKTQTSPRFINPWRRYVGSFVPNWLLRRREISAHAKLCYARLAQYAGQKGVAYPRQDTMAAELGVSPRTICRYIGELREHGLIYVEDRRNKNFPNKYKFLDHPWQYDGDEIIDDEEDHTTEVTSGGSGGSGASSTVKNHTTGLTCGPPGPHDKFDVSGHDRSVVSRRDSLEETHQEEENHPARPASRSGRKRKRPPPGPPAPKTFADPGPSGAYGESAASGAEEEEEFRTSALDNALDKKTRPVSHRAKKAAEAAAKAKAKADKQAAKNAKRSMERQRVKKQLAEGKGQMPKGATKELERQWRALLGERLPGVEIAKWGGKERGQVKQLLEKYDGKIVSDALRYVVENWESIRSRIFRGKAGHPTVGMILKLHDSLVVESQTWAKHNEVIEEYKEWSKANPYELDAPGDLEARYRKAKAELEAIGES